MVHDNKSSIMGASTPFRRVSRCQPRKGWPQTQYHHPKGCHTRESSEQQSAGLPVTVDHLLVSRISIPALMNNEAPGGELDIDSDGSDAGGTASSDASSEIDKMRITSVLNPTIPEDRDLSIFTQVTGDSDCSQRSYPSTSKGGRNTRGKSAASRGRSTKESCRRKTSNKPYPLDQVHFVQYHRNDLHMRWKDVLKAYNTWFVLSGRDGRGNGSGLATVSGLQGRYYRSLWFPLLDVNCNPIYGDDSEVILHKIYLRKRKERRAFTVPVIDSEGRPLMRCGHVVKRELSQEEQDGSVGQALEEAYRSHNKLADRAPEVACKYEWIDPETRRKLAIEGKVISFTGPCANPR
jgi:hypothetical protein